MTDRHLRAYYYGFEPTGNDHIDAILEAVAVAGKMHHHTDGWNDDEYGPSPVEQIQSAANNAAAHYAPKGTE